MERRKVNPIRRILALLLVFVSVISLVNVVTGIQDVLAVQAYLEGDGTDQLAPLKDGLDQLAENEETYFEGVETYNEGVAQLADGAQQLKDGEVAYAEGKQQLADGEAELADGYAQYEAGKQELAEGQKQIDENTDAYNEGKETIESIEPILPYLETYLNFRNGYLTELPGFDCVQQLFASVIRPLGAELGLDIPEDENDLPQYIMDMVADGRIQLKTYEDGLVALEEGKQQLADAEVQLADGEAQLADGRAQLAEGKATLEQGYADYADGQEQLAEGDAQLKEFEDGEKQIISDGFDTVFALENYVSRNGDITVKSPAEKLGKDFDYYKYDEDGNKVLLRDGTQAIDLDKGYEIYESAQEYVDDITNTATAELYGRIYAYIALAVAAVLGLIAGILGMFGKSAVMAVLAGVASLVPLIMSLVKGATNYTYTLEDGTGTGMTQFAIMIVLAVVAICHAIVAVITKPSKEVLEAEKAAKKAKKEAKKAEKEAAAAEAE